MIMGLPYQRLINVLQGKTAHWIAGMSDGTGLYTDEVANCKIFIILGEKMGRPAITLCHCDTGFDFILDECAQFTVVNHIACAVNEYQHQEERAAAYQYDFLPAFRHLQAALLAREDLPNLEGPINIGRENPHNDALAVYYSAVDGEPEIKFLIGEQLREYPIVLINHPKAPSIYSFCKLNTMAEEIVAEWRYLAKYSRGEIQQVPNSNLLRFEGEDLHVSVICKRLSSPIVHQRLLYDGQNFMEPGIEDDGLSAQASQFFEGVPTRVGSIEELTHPLADRLVALEMQALQVYNPFHQPRKFHHDLQTSAIACFYAAQVLKLQIGPDSEHAAHGATLRRYGEDEPRQIERQRIKLYLDQSQREIFGSREGFFSPSRHASIQQPYGPYADCFCSSDDIIVGLGVRRAVLG